MPPDEPVPSHPCPKPADEVVLLVNHDFAYRYRAMLESRFPRIRQVYVDNYRDLPDALERERPDVVLSFRIKREGAFPRDLLFGAPSVRWLHAGSAGVDHLTPWDPAKLVVTNSSGIQAEPMAQYAAWAVLNQVLRMPLYADQQRRREWTPHETLIARSFSAVVVGFGRIGQAVGETLKRFGMRVTGVRTRPAPAPGAADAVVGAERLDEVLGQADFVILTVPKTPSTERLFGAATLARMKRGAYLVNLARGGIVDEEALHAAILTGRLSGAALDVFADEPLPPSAALWEVPGVTITPHVASDVVGWHVLVAELFADNLDRWLRGEPIVNVCDPSRGY